MALSPQPPAPVRGFSFTDWQVAHPDEPPPGDRLDGEYDRTNNAVSGALDWVATTLNTDGSLRPGTVGESQLVSGLFNDIAQGIIDEVQPLVDTATAAAGSALASAGAADVSEANAEAANVAAQGAKSDALAAANLTNLAKLDAQASATTAGNKATDAANAANHAAGDAALAEDWGLVAQAWAEHMPDPIPPNLLAVMGVTGDHWSSRWWANKAAGAFGSMSALYLGAQPTPPTSTATGEPIPTGALYFNTSNNTTYVWDGAEWQPLTQPGKGVVSSLVYRATAGQTVFDTHTFDITGANFIMKPDTPVEVYVNGVRAIPNVPAGQGDYVLDTVASTITFVQPLLADTMVQVDLMIEPSDLAPAGVTTIAVLDFNIDPATGTPGQIDGTRRSFPLARASDRTSITVSRASDLCVVLDGVIQQPDSDYTATASTITFTEAPLVGADAWGLWYAPGPPGAGGSYLPLTGGTLSGPLLLNADPTVSLGAATKQYVDAKAGAYLPLTGGTVTGATTFNAGLTATTLVASGSGTIGANAATTPVLAINGAAGNTRRLEFLSGGSLRARWMLDSAAESGNNAGSTPTLNLYGDAGGLVGTAWTVSRKTLQSFFPLLLVGKSFAYAGGAPDNNSVPLFISTSFTGSTDGSGWVGLANWNINTDTLDVGANQQAIGLYANQNWGGAGTRGGRTGIRWSMVQRGVCGPGNFQSGLFSCAAQYSAGGTDVWAGSSGNVFGAGFYGGLASGALNWRGIAGAEVDYYIESGASALALTGLQICKQSQSQYSPPAFDRNVVLKFSDAVGSVGSKIGLQFGGDTGQWPLAADAAMITASFCGNYLTAPMSAARGVDFGAVNFSGVAWRSAGYSVGADGTVQVGTAYLSGSATSVDLDAKGSYVSAAAVATGGANLAVGSPLIDDATGTILRVTAISGGAATAVAIYRVGYAATPPANPVTFRVVPLGADAAQPTAPTINLTWVAQSNLRIQPSGGTTTFGGSTAHSGAATFQSGASFGSTVVGSVTDTSKHIALYGSSYGITVSAGRLNYLSAGIHAFTNAAGTDMASISSTTGITVGASGAPNIRSGTGAATGTQPKGSLWMRTDGAVGSTLYVSQGGGTWNAVAGV